MPNKKKVKNKVVARKFLATDEKMVKRISDVLFKEGIAYKVSVKHYIIAKEFKVTFTTEPIGEEIREILATKIGKK